LFRVTLPVVALLMPPPGKLDVFPSTRLSVRVSAAPERLKMPP